MTAAEPERRAAANCTHAHRKPAGCAVVGAPLRHPRRRRRSERRPNEAACLEKASRRLNVELRSDAPPALLLLQWEITFPIFPPLPDFLLG